MSKKGRILLIKPILPYPPDSGTKIVSFNLIKALSGEYDVTVLTRLTGREQKDQVRGLQKHCSRVVAVLAPNKRSFAHRVFYKFFYYLKSYMRKRSLKGLYDCPDQLVRAARKLAAEDFDIVIIEYWQMFRLANLFPPNKTILLTHDIDLDVNKQISMIERRLIKKIRAVRKWLVEKTEETEAYKTFNIILTLTGRDKTAVERIASSGARVEVLPFGMDLDRYLEIDERRNAGEILFMGAMDAPFNRDALEYFIREIHPHLRDLDGLQISIVGGALPRHLRKFAPVEGVRVIGRVQDVRPHLRRASCMVIPLRYGGGLRIRILEAAAAELPLVCTGVAAAGMPFEANRDYLLAGNPEEFRAAVRKLLESPEKAAAMAARARRRVEAEYSLGEQRRRILELMAQLFNSK